MTNFVGYKDSGISGQLPASSDLSAGSYSFALGGKLQSSLSGPEIVRTLSVANQNFAGTVDENFGVLWEQSINVPMAKNLGSVVSQQTFAIERWSTSRTTEHVIESVGIYGTGGVTISATFPFSIGPGGSMVLTATIPQRGDATIAQEIRFYGHPAGVNLARDYNVPFEITGSRIILFPFDPDWSNGIQEKSQYLTGISTARSGKEQRYRLRLTPRRSLAFSVAALSEQLAQYLEGLLTGQQSGMWAVPWWPEQAVYSGSLAAGATSISIPTTGTLFTSAPMVMIWADPLHCEVQTVQSVGPTVVTCSALQGSYTDPLVVPVFPGRLGSKVKVARITSKISRTAFDFQCEVAP